MSPFVEGILFLLMVFAIVVASSGLLSLDMVARGLTDLGESWWGIAAWAFRVPGVAFGLLALPITPLVAAVLSNRYKVPKMAQERPPTDLPAAAVSMLEEGVVTSRTLLTIVVEMCQRGTLEITGVREAPYRSGDFDYRGEYKYRVKALEKPRFPWERTVCDALPRVEVSVSSLAHWLEEQKCDISRQIDSHLRQQGLFHDHPMARANPARRVRTLPRLGGLLLFTGLVMWLMFLEGSSEVKAIVGFTAVLFGGISYLYGAMAVDEFVVNLSWSIPNRRGRDEKGRWMAYGEHLESLGSHSAGRLQPDELLPYAVALNVAGPWLHDHTEAPAWLQVASTRKAKDLPRSPHRAYHGLMSSKCWDLKGRSERSEEWAMELFYSGRDGGGAQLGDDGGD